MKKDAQKMELPNVPMTDDLRKMMIAAKSQEIQNHYQSLINDLKSKMNKDIKEFEDFIKASPYFVAGLSTEKQKKKRGWDNADLDELKNLYGTISPKQIANKLNKTYQAVMTKITELGLKEPYKWSPAEEQELIDLYAQKQKNKINAEGKEVIITDEDHIQFMATKMKISVIDIKNKIQEFKENGKILTRFKGLKPIGDDVFNLPDEQD